MACCLRTEGSLLSVKGFSSCFTNETGAVIQKLSATPPWKDPVTMHEGSEIGT